jgi:putative peptide zinc metalloprotease protein
MQNLGEISDLERRKKVRVRLRPDLGFTASKYEGRTYYVVKDPVSLRYYRFKEHERFLLDYMDGQKTLEEAQKAFEQRFRPERLTLEDLEAFTSQLLQAGLAQNETPNAGKQLYDRYWKRQKNKVLQYLMNIMYIKIPVFDPDKILTKMVKPLAFIFTTWFLVLSVAYMLAAGLLVATHWSSFTAKLPAYHEFFNFRTIAYMWIALGAVKVIHEFGHGLSCKAFGGEVHEMGFLFLVFSPCLYCNVSDAWTLPNKWHRILISAAGIYVELIIAATATFIWWNTPPGTFIYNLCMSLMVVCSVSTFVFNANPLMRFDGYYVLSDWIEIPNLREKSNKFLGDLAKEYLLGMEVPPQPYMERSRQILFVVYAITAWVYRWVITFSILYFMYTFLEPYKLGAISYMLGTAAVGSMFGMPIYKLGKFLHRRGRLPDMKPWRVGVTTVLTVIAIIVILSIPFPMNVYTTAVVQVDPQETARIVVPESGGFLSDVRVKEGQEVKAGEILAVLRNPDLEIEIQDNENQQRARKQQINDLKPRLWKSKNISIEISTAQNQLDALLRLHKQLLTRKRQLELRAPRAGTVMHLVQKEAVGKLLEKDNIVCEVGNPAALRAMLLVPGTEYKLVREKAEAVIHVHGHVGHTFNGTVVSIAASEAREVPPQLNAKAGGDVATQTDPQTNQELPQTQHYLVTVKFNQADQTVQPGVLAKVKIRSEPRTLWWRGMRYLETTFNFGL